MPYILNEEDARVLRRLARMHEATTGPGVVAGPDGAAHGPPPKSRFRPTGGGDGFPGALAGNTLQTGHAARWDYPFAEMQLTSTGYQLLPGGRTGTAVNLAELAHTAEPAHDQPWYVWGVQCHRDYGGSYPAGFAPRPVGGGGTDGTHKVDQVVWITVMSDVDRGTVYIFERTGSHDGTCAV